MQKIKIFLIFVSFIFLAVNLAEAQTNRTNKSKSKKSVKSKAVNKQGCPLDYYSMIGNKAVAHYNCLPEVTKLNLSATKIYAECSAQEKTCADRKQNIEVSVEAIDQENDSMTYCYKVAGGKIIGAGKNIVWDVTDLKPGTYTIIASVDDGKGCSGAMTKTLEVVACPDCQ